VRRLLILSLLLLSPAIPSAAKKPAAPVKDVTFDGGPLDGIVLGTLVQADGKPGFGLKPSLPNTSPLPGKYAAPIQGFLDAYERKQPERYQAYFSPDAKSQFCDGPVTNNCYASEPFEDLPVEEHCQPNTPYFMGSGGDYQVRLEWVFKGQLYYISFVTLKNSRISKVITARAKPPVLVRSSAVPHG
jgi:hypothetical protein